MRYKFNYPSAAAVVFCGHLSTRAAFQLDRKSPAVLRVASYVVRPAATTDIKTENLYDKTL